MLAPVLGQLTKTFPKDVQIVYRHFPLNGHDKSMLASQAAEAAGKQGKFWEMHDAIFSGQDTWAAYTPEQFEPWLVEQAKGLELDATKFETDLKSDEIVKKVTQAQADAMKIPIPGTPFLLINGKPYEGPRDADSLTAIVNLTTLQQRQYSECPPMTIDAKKLYTATIKTDAGDIVVQLFPDKTPMTVNSFVFLAQHGWFDNTIFHRVLPGFIAQAGDPSGSGYGGPGYAFSNEITATAHFDKPGLVGMANSGPNSNGSQFFITYAPAPDLDGQYTIFGQVIQGMDVARKLNARDPNMGGALPEASKILTVTITEK
jgi:cyclophilin family peptidyl-prolyl cis-trans isomerase